jgi:AAA family ATP:ADP antiporter
LVKRFLSLWRQFLPMLSLFFCLSFINTILDSLKDTLVITAVGGGAFVIPYLTVYAVLPMSMVFLVAFSAASQRMSRSALFNTIVAVFVAFFAVFALFLYPNADALHPHAVADQLQQVRKTPPV